VGSLGGDRSADLAAHPSRRPGHPNREEEQVADHDLEALWAEHCRHEFETRDVDATMATMVPDPYVNHVPTMTSGVGHDALKRFYKYRPCCTDRPVVPGAG
jgi:hypothetical protein